MPGSGEGPGNLHVRKPLLHSGGYRPHFGDPEVSSRGLGWNWRTLSGPGVWQVTGEGAEGAQSSWSGTRGFIGKAGGIG